jgi:ribosomal-protein-alanine N-acetyltransferase
MVTNCTHSLMAEKDLDEVLSIEREAFPHPWTKDFFRLIMQDTSNYFVTLKQGKNLIGYGGYHLLMNGSNFLDTNKLYTSLIHLINIAIHAHYRNQGLGRHLLNLLISNAKTRNAEYCYLEMRPSNNRAFRFYKSFGFSVIGVIENYYPIEEENAIVMGKELSSLMET